MQWKQLNALDDKLLQAGIHADELSGNHLAALDKQLQLIDHQSMQDLVQSFNELEKASDAVMTQLQAHWYQFGSGSKGAQNALEDFKREYDLLLAKGKDKEASDLLAGTLQSAERILRLQETAKRDWDATAGHGGTMPEKQNEYERARIALKLAGTGYTEKEIASQENLVETLRAQVEAQQKIHDLKTIEQSNVRANTQTAIGDDADKRARAEGDAIKQEQDQQDKEQQERYQRAVDAIQQAEKQKIAATDQGSAQRLAIIDAAIKEEDTKGLQETGFFKQLLTARVDTAKQLADMQAQQAEEAGRERAQHTAKMGELQVAAERDADALRLSAKQKGDAEIVRSAIAAENETYLAKLAAYSQQIAALDSTGKDYENKLKALQDREIELRQDHENKITEIKDRAEMERNTRILGAERQFQDSIASGLSSVLTGHQSFAHMMDSIGSQVAQGMLQNALKSIMAEDMTKEHDAAAAARKGFLAGMSFPFPVNLVMGPTLGAAAFASVMAFAEGGIVPGIGNKDIVPAMLTPGETVLPKRMTEQLAHASAPDSGQNRPVHLHFHPTYHVNTIDSDGVEGMLQKHSEQFSKHFHSELRKINR